jgi:hypothetical protein
MGRLSKKQQHRKKVARMRKGQTRDNFPSKARLKDAGVAPAPFESAKRLIGETPTGRLPGQLTLARPELREKILNAVRRARRPCGGERAD